MTQDPSGAEPSPQEITIKDIARMAGVSISTVSRVINAPDMVTLPKRTAVQEVMARVNYIPNNMARSLVHRRSRTIGVIVPTLKNPIFAPTIGAIEETVEAEGYGLLISCSHRDPAKELAQARTMIERGVEGIVLTGAYRHPDLLPLLAARGVRAVSQDDPEGGPGLVALAMPDAAAMALAVDRLVALGHRRIAVITGPTANTRPIALRFEAACARLAHHGIDIAQTGHSEAGDYSAEAARIATRRLLAAGTRPTAIACTGDVPAIGVVAECRAQGLSVPGDVSITGCGDTVMAQYVQPALATVRLPFENLGHRAALLLLGQIEGRDPGPLPDLGYGFVDRASIRAI